MSSAQSAGSSSVWAGHALTVTVTTDLDQRSRVRVAGELTGGGAALLRDCLTAQLESGSRHAGLDLSAVSVADDDGLAALLDAHRAYRACRGTLIVASVSPEVRRLVTTSHADGELLIDARADLPPISELPTHDAGTG